MTDKFLKAIVEVGDYVAEGMSLDEAVTEVAAEFDLPAPALKNRAERRFGDIEVFRATKKIEAKEQAIRDRIAANLRKPIFERNCDREMLEYIWKRR